MSEKALKASIPHVLDPVVIAVELQPGMFLICDVYTDFKWHFVSHSALLIMHGYNNALPLKEHMCFKVTIHTDVSTEFHI